MMFISTPPFGCRAYIHHTTWAQTHHWSHCWCTCSGTTYSLDRMSKALTPSPQPVAIWVALWCGFQVAHANVVSPFEDRLISPASYKVHQTISTFNIVHKGLCIIAAVYKVYPIIPNNTTSASNDQLPDLRLAFCQLPQYQLLIIIGSQLLNSGVPCYFQYVGWSPVRHTASFLHRREHAQAGWHCLGINFIL